MCICLIYAFGALKPLSARTLAMSVAKPFRSAVRGAFRGMAARHLGAAPQASTGRCGVPNPAFTKGSFGKALRKASRKVLRNVLRMALRKAGKGGKQTPNK